MAKIVPVTPRDITPPDSLWDDDNKDGGNKNQNNVGVNYNAVVLKGWNNGQDLIFTSSTAMRSYFNRLIQKRDPRLKDLVTLLGAGNNIKLAREIWNDAVSWSFDNSKPGKPADFLKLATSERFRQFGLDIPKKYLGGTGGGAAGPTRQDYITITAKKDAKDILRQTMFDLIGRAPTDEEYAQFTKRLNNLENKFFKSTQYGPTGQRTTGRNIDPKLIAERFVLRKTDFAQDLEGEAGSIQDTINQLINMNGLNGFITEKRKKELVRSLVRGELKQDGLNALLRDESKKIYKAFASMLDANPTASLYDVADPYISVYASMFEMGEAQIDIKDVLKKATKVDDKGNESVMSIFEFEKMLRTDPRFQSTSKARSEASDLATGFARAFGVNL